MKRRFRVGISCYPTYGGSGAVAVDLAAELAGRGHEVHVVSYASPVKLETRPGLFFHEVDVSAYPLFKYPPYEMALSSRLSDVALRFRLDIIHAHYAIPHSVSACLAREIVGRDRVRVVTTLHGTDITLVGSDPAYRPITRWALQRSDAVTAVSEFLRAETEQKLCGECRTRVIHNFVNIDRFHPGLAGTWRASLAPDGDWLLAHVSNFRPVKRVADVVAIFAGVNASHPSRLVLVGDGPDRALAERTAQKLGVEDRVLFLGPVSEVGGVVASADALLLPSDGESFGLAALEALACGVPVVGARAGGLGEVVTDGVNGILEPVGDVAAMVRRTVELLSDSAAHARARLAARDAAVTRFRSELLVPQYEAAYAAAWSG